MKDIEIYPSSWYYNACVQGFMEIIAHGIGEDGNRIIEEEILHKDGRAVIPGDLANAIFNPCTVPMPARYRNLEYNEVPNEIADLKRIAWWWIQKSQALLKKSSSNFSNSHELIKATCNSYLGSNKTFYPNLLPHNDKTSRIQFLNNWFSLANGGNVHCSFCNALCQLDVHAKEKEQFFIREISAHFGSSITEFPNGFWDGNPNFIMCRHCRSYFLCFHIVYSYGFFVNSDSLMLNWHLNSLLTAKTRKQKTSHYTLLLNAIRYDPQLRSGVGSWGLQNLEVIVFMNNKIKHHPVSPRLARLFMVPKISSLISRIAEPIIWEIILEERFDYLLTIIYKSLRVLRTGKNESNDPEVIVKEKNKDSLTFVVDLIEFYAEVKKLDLNSSEERRYTNMLDLWKIRNEAKNAPLALDNNLVFRLLELTRLNKKAEVYHLLLRTYVVNEMPFPGVLADLFNIEDANLFKSGIYAYISGLKAPENHQD
ncbi:CRISPR-associated protein Cst1 [Thermosyntropha lipolytica DSM 11003]|uniref:CRISPR-associated protein Cst1 n=1 Tax=Thermosyntropha lipolytica DSM 11003 TaxID=1123382 RepID=A0A1M5Q2T3_9FIRM|nr:type I-B CRISPR-associated protein Cas8b1/Cst1 [Thermosyntropha lipolytica]SHH08425.1 CRISPR-associated protein Cst1 [Thermosyntropha lipolytica DSM 11003]